MESQERSEGAKPVLFPQPHCLSNRNTNYFMDLVLIWCLSRDILCIRETLTSLNKTSFIIVLTLFSSYLTEQWFANVCSYSS